MSQELYIPVRRRHYDTNALLETDMATRVQEWAFDEDNDYHAVVRKDGTFRYISPSNLFRPGDGANVVISCAADDSATFEGDLIVPNKITYSRDPATYIQLGGGAETLNQVKVFVDSFEMIVFKNLPLSDPGIVINELGADIDFRIESNDAANIFSIDGGNNTINFTGADAGATGGVFMKITDQARELCRFTSEAVIVNYDKTLVEFRVSGDTTTDFFTVDTGAENLTINGVGNPLTIYANTAQAFTITTTDIVINEGSQDLDFRIESNDAANILSIDGENNTINFTGADAGATGGVFMKISDQTREVCRFTSEAVLVNDGLEDVDFFVMRGTSGDFTTGLFHVDGGLRNVSISGPADDTEIFNITTNAKELVSFEGTQVLFNDGLEDIDFFIMRDTSGEFTTGLFYVDAGLKNVSITGPADDTQIFSVTTNGKSLVLCSGTSVVFNEGGADIDFRIESNDAANILSIDGENNTINFTGADAGATGGVFMKISDQTREVCRFTSEAVIVNYGKTLVEFRVSGDSTTDFFTVDTGAENLTIDSAGSPLTVYAATLEIFKITTTDIVFNEAGVNVDFRIEDDNDTYAFMVRGSDGYVTFGGGAEPDEPFCIDNLDNNSYLKIEEVVASIANYNSESAFVRVKHSHATSSTYYMKIYAADA